MAANSYIQQAAEDLRWTHCLYMTSLGQVHAIEDLVIVNEVTGQLKRLMLIELSFGRQLPGRPQLDNLCSKQM